MNIEWDIENDFGDKGETALVVKSKELPYRAYIKWDGCCELYKHNYDNNGKLSRNDYNQIHVCSIPRFIEILQSLEDFRINNIGWAE